MTVNHSYFSDNVAAAGGAIAYEFVLYPAVSHSTFYNNSATRRDGGAINCQLYGYVYYFSKIQKINFDYPLNERDVTCLWQVQNPFYFLDNLFDSNVAVETAGAIFMDYTYAQTQVVGNLSRSETNITDT